MRKHKKLSGSDKLFFYALLPFAGIVFSIFVLLIKVLFENSIPILEREGLQFIITSEWNPSENNPLQEYYGILSPLFGTVYVSTIAVVLALPLSVSLSVFVEEYVPTKIRATVVNLMEVMAGLPTVIYGLWGVFVLAPFLKENVMIALNNYLWFIPLFSCSPTSPLTLFTAAIVLAIMIVPFVSSIIREAYKTIPLSYREAILGLGATKQEYVWTMLQMVKPAIISGVLLGFGRAAGETIAVSMTIGNSFSLSTCLFDPGYTISSLIANQFANAGFYKYMTSSLYGAGLVLVIIGLILNSIGLYMIMRWRRNFEEA